MRPFKILILSISGALTSAIARANATRLISSCNEFRHPGHCLGIVQQLVGKILWQMTAAATTGPARQPDYSSAAGFIKSEVKEDASIPSVISLSLMAKFRSQYTIIRITMDKNPWTTLSREDTTKTRDQTGRI